MKKIINTRFPMGSMKQYPIEREKFTQLFYEKYKVYELLEDKDLQHDGEFFKVWYDYDEETIYLLEKESGILITWYKFNHIGRCLECNKDLTEDDFELFAFLLELELKDKLFDFLNKCEEEDE